MTRKIALLTMTFALFFAFGCSKTKSIDLTYQPTEIKSCKCANPLTVFPVIDERTDDKLVLGKTPTRSIVATSSVADWASAAFVDQLVANGCEVLVTEPAAYTSGYAVQPILKKTFMDQTANRTFRMNTLMDVLIYENGELIYQKSYTGKSKLDGTTSQGSQAMTEQMQNLLSVIVPDIVKMTK